MSYTIAILLLTNATFFLKSVTLGDASFVILQVHILKLYFRMKKKVIKVLNNYSVILYYLQ